MTNQDLITNINDRIEELKNKLGTQVTSDYLVTLIYGEIEGLRWVRELIEESEK